MESIEFLYESKCPEFKFPFGALKQDEKCRINFKISRHLAVLSANLVIENDGVFYKKIPLSFLSLDGSFDVYSAEFSLSDSGLYFYYFELCDSSESYYVSKSQKVLVRGIYEKWQITCYDKNYIPPSGFDGGIMYQIFPDRFYFDSLCDTKNKLTPFFIHNSTKNTPNFLPDENGIIQNNDFFGGNLSGIKEKLHYLRELGVSIIYLNPIFYAYSNHRYDTADYHTIDPLLGNEEDFKELCDKAHSLGIKIVLDGVFSHTGSNSIYFDKEKIFGTGAYQNPSSPYFSWYDFRPDGSYSAWWGIDTLPCVNELSPSFIDYIIENENSVIAHWLKLGADGFRLDVADELPDSFIMSLKKRVQSIKKDAIVIGEVWEDASNKISYEKRRTYFTGSIVELDSVMNYPFKNAILDLLRERISVQNFEDIIMQIAENYPKPIFYRLMNSLSTHDTERVLSVLGDTPPLTREERASYSLSKDSLHFALEREKAAVFLQFLLPGIPCIYYGDEVGLEGFEDPFNRRFYPWGEENKDLKKFYINMAELRNLIPKDSEITFIPHSECVIFRRGDFIAVCNPKNKEQRISCKYSMPYYLKSSILSSNTLFIKPYGFALLKAL